MNVLAFVLTIIFFLLMVSLIVWAIGGWDEVLSFWGFRSWVRPKLVEPELLKPYPRRDHDQELTDILKEAEKMREELPLVTLWWGLDGLQMKRDGTLEWISKKPKEPEPYSGFLRPPPIPEYPIGGYLQMPADWDFGGMCMRYSPILHIPTSDLEDTTCKIYIQDLRNQLNVAQWQEFQNYQTRAILDNLKQWEVVNEEKGSYVKVTDISGNSYLEPCVWTHSQEKHTL